MKITNENRLYEMANLNPAKSGLNNIIIWSEHNGISRNISHSNSPRVKMGNNDYIVEVSISEDPIILSKPKKLSMKKALSIFSEGLKYIKRNYDIFLKHYNDTDFSFDDEDFFNALRDRKEYK